MNDGFQFIDIILFAMIAVFLILRLRSVLGRRDGTDGKHVDPFRKGDAGNQRSGPTSKNQKSDDADNVVHLPDHRDNDTDPKPSKASSHDDMLEMFGLESAGDESGVNKGLRQIMSRDSNFDPDGFIGGAQSAFEMILEAFGSGDRNTLKSLLHPDVYEDFSGAIDAREAADEIADNTLVGIKDIDITEAEMDGSVANVTLRFVTEQVLVTRDKDGEVTDGDPNYVSTVTDQWTFARDTRASDPNWMLVATGTPD